MENPINDYGDRLIQAGAGHGSDIASQRQDELDAKSIAWADTLLKTGAQVKALDLGAGRGAQAARLLAAGAHLAVAVDREDFTDEFQESVKKEKGVGIFLKLDFTKDNFKQDIAKRLDNPLFDIVIFQRAIHYLPYADAAEALANVREMLRSGGRLFLSASGMESELSSGYSAGGQNIELRFGHLAADMALRHGIAAPVCLYENKELVSLCQGSGLRVLEAQQSAFGNVKIIAERP